MLKASDKAINFVLKNQNNEDVSLSDYLGKKVVLYFYPKDNSPGCTAQACNFRDLDSEIQNEGAVILGMSKDSVNAHQKFATKKSLPFDILSDEGLKVAKAYGIVNETGIFKGARRCTFIIDEQGYIEKVFEDVKPSTDAKNVLDYLKGISV